MEWKFIDSSILAVDVESEIKAQQVSNYLQKCEGKEYIESIFRVHSPLLAAV